MEESLICFFQIPPTKASKSGQLSNLSSYQTSVRINTCCSSYFIFIGYSPNGCNELTNDLIIVRVAGTKVPYSLDEDSIIFDFLLDIGILFYDVLEQWHKCS